MITESDKSTLKIMAGVDEIIENNRDRKSIEFNFKNSLKANYAKLVEYSNGRFILQLRKRGEDQFNNTYDKLVFEGVIKPQEFKDVFEKQTGIYLNLY